MKNSAAPPPAHCPPGQARHFPMPSRSAIAQPPQSRVTLSWACGVSPSSASSRACSTQPSRRHPPLKPSRFSSTQATSSGVQAAIWSKWIEAEPVQQLLHPRPDALDQLQVVRPAVARRRPAPPARSPPRRSASLSLAVVDPRPPLPPRDRPRRRRLAGDPRHRVAQPLGQRHRGVGVQRRAARRSAWSARPAARTRTARSAAPAAAPRRARTRRAARRSSRPSGPRSNPCRSAPSAHWRRRRGTRPLPS